MYWFIFAACLALMILLFGVALLWGWLLARKQKPEEMRSATGETPVPRKKEVPSEE